MNNEAFWQGYNDWYKDKYENPYHSMEEDFYHYQRGQKFARKEYWDWAADKFHS